MTRTQWLWALGLPVWLCATLGVLRLGDIPWYAASCLVEGPWG
jgi:hypothetical protein